MTTKGDYRDDDLQVNVKAWNFKECIHDDETFSLVLHLPFLQIRTRASVQGAVQYSLHILIRHQ